MSFLRVWERKDIPDFDIPTAEIAFDRRVPGTEASLGLRVLVLGLVNKRVAEEASASFDLRVERSVERYNLYGIRKGRREIEVSGISHGSRE